MLPISIMGLFFNLIQMKILHQDDPVTIHDIPDDSASAKIKDDTVKVSLLDDGNSASKTQQNDEPARNINVESAYLHVLGDMLMSVGVITAATIIYFRPDLWWFDPICTYCFAVMILVTSYPTLKSCLDILMEGAPENINADELTQDIWD